MRRFLAWFYKVRGWKVEGDFPRDIKKYVIIVAPHTSNWDFITGVLARAYLRMGHAKYLGKDSLFKPPHGWIFYGLGGYPVERSKSHNYVQSVVNIFEKEDSFVLALAPEGTRKKVERLKTGFWHIAHQAKVPVVLCGFNYKEKAVIIQPRMETTTIEEDMPKIMEFFSRMVGKVPENGVGPVTSEV